MFIPILSIVIEIIIWIETNLVNYLSAYLEGKKQKATTGFQTYWHSLVLERVGYY